MKKLMKLFAVTMAMVMALSLAGCGSSTTSETTAAAETTTAASASEDSSDRIVKGEGATTFYFDVVDADANETHFEINTDETTVGAALTSLDLIEGEDSEYGLYVKVVNGIEADYDKDQVYWAFYIDGEYAETGVDSTDVVAGSTYSFKIEK